MSRDPIKIGYRSKCALASAKHIALGSIATISNYFPPLGCYFAPIVALTLSSPSLIISIAIVPESAVFNWK